MPRKEFDAFTRLDASDVNTFLMDQSVMTFADSTARTTAIPTPVQGMLTYLEDSNTYESYNGSAYVTVADGSGWTTFVPTLIGVTVGNGTFNYAKFKTIGKTVNIGINFQFGSTSAVTGDIQIEVPTAISRTANRTAPVISAIFRDDTPSVFSIASCFPSTTSSRRIILRATNAAGTYLSSTTASSTIPFTWTTGDEILFTGSYEID
jgi:hypothetical protein